MAKTVAFWPWWQPFNSFCIQTLSFFPLFHFFLLATQKKLVGGYAPPDPPPPSVASPEVMAKSQEAGAQKCSLKIIVPKFLKHKKDNF